MRAVAVTKAVAHHSRRGLLKRGGVRTAGEIKYWFGFAILRSFFNRSVLAFVRHSLADCRFWQHNKRHQCAYLDGRRQHSCMIEFWGLLEAWPAGSAGVEPNLAVSGPPRR